MMTLAGLNFHKLWMSSESKILQIADATNTMMYAPPDVYEHR